MAPAIVLRGDARNLPLPDGCVDLIVTSPPYFGLRDYGYAGQIGSEATPGEWLEALWACTAEWVRVLKPEGSLFVNLGDKYAGGQPHSNHGTGASTLNGHGGAGTIKDRAGKFRRTADFGDAQPKSLLGLPWRYAIGCMDRLGLILRAEVIWAKPNGLPESVTDRVRRAHEQVFHFTRQPRYYAAVDEIREDYSASTQRSYQSGNGAARVGGSIHHHPSFTGRRVQDALPEGYAGNPLGKLPGSVWEIPSAPLQVPAHLGVDHFAAFPPALVRPIVLGWSPPGVCTACAQGRRPVVERPSPLGNVRTSSVDRVSTPRGHLGSTSTIMLSGGARQKWEAANPPLLTGYACACPEPDAPTRPAVVLDPFGGTGTTALVASAYGRTGVTVDLSADYCRLAAWRVSDPGERARARDMPKPPPVPDGMEPLFDMKV